MEAIIGAIYLDQGMEVARPLVLRLFGPLISRAGELGAGLDWKTSLQEAASSRSRAAGLWVSTMSLAKEGSAGSGLSERKKRGAPPPR